ncbi:hypothetical protein BDZ91DRAFT_438717 [Kalaharituber pfeilii]|nr:hypothetical protein BDZ91DRAFT_438717 [Kalaharituber pfeilii]
MVSVPVTEMLDILPTRVPSQLETRNENTTRGSLLPEGLSITKLFARCKLTMIVTLMSFSFPISRMLGVVMLFN